ncbi:lymphocyte antigen 6D [Nematostella vectensis]|uniref:lymphocyte antigen 6D n=1 Tax=Nematostella vectensis TaxID=45351 RepID=UPI0020775C1B|nr:lymphocyte antigen 6D [Nematostella vectensis]
MAKVLIVVLAVMCAIQMGHALKCSRHVCSKLPRPYPAQPCKSEVAECPFFAYGCTRITVSFKMYGTRVDQDIGDCAYSHQCTSEYEKKFCDSVHAQSNLSDIKCNVKCCQGDLCNNAM